MGRMCLRLHILPYFMLMQASCHAVVTFLSRETEGCCIVE